MPGQGLGAGRTRLRAALRLAPFLLAACAPSGGAPDPDGALGRLESFGFVQAGSVAIYANSRHGSTTVGVGEPLLVGMYEVTRAEFRRYRDAALPALDPLIADRMSRWTSADSALPVSFVTRREAEDYARWAGARLPTASEWLFCAISPRMFAYPWSDSWQQGRANTLELGIVPIGPTPVGTFEGGRTETHLYDMLGNVCEWVEDDPAGALAAEGRVTALGGSYATFKREIQREGALFAQAHEPGTRLDDLGFRICAPARAWLSAHAAELGGSAESRLRLTSIGRRWGPSAVPLLTELARDAQGAARGSLEAILGGARG